MNQNKSEPKLNSEIVFKPITEGLGFHPFSDGLPYAPVSKSTQKPPLSKPSAPAMKSPDYNKGDGALNVGLPRKVSVPVAQKPLHSELHSTLMQQKQQSVSPEIRATFGPYYFAKRVGAYLLDTFLSAMICFSALGWLIVQNELKSDFYLDPSVILLTTLFMLMMNWVIMTLEEICFSNTVGKKVFGLMLGGKKRFRLLRALLFVPSVGLFGLGLFLGFFDHKKRCWHDRLANLQPYEV